MSKIIETSLVVRKETVYDKIRRSLFSWIYQEDYIMLQKLEYLLKPKRLAKNTKIIIPNEIGKDIKKY